MTSVKLSHLARLGVLPAALCMSATMASAATGWTDWTSATPGAPGSANGTVGGVGITYSGELGSANVAGTDPRWAPDSSFIGGTVTTSPSTVGDNIFLNGSFTGTNTITFSTPVVNPVFAIWSLGQPSLAASFNFIAATPTFEAGGPNSQFGGAPLQVSGNTVSGNEGNGVVQFTGTFSSISWTNSFENFYSFTVGVNGASVPAIPEPETYALMLAGLGVVAAFAKRRRR